jgi:hypothetical protein
MTRFALTATLLLFPATAFAETQLERFENLSESMNQLMVEMMAFEIENLGGDATALRDVRSTMPEWDDDMRAAGGCILDQYRDATDNAEVDALLDRLDAALPVMQEMGMTEFAESEMAETMLPVGMTLEDSARINQECGMMELQLRDMQETGFTEAMMAASATVPSE